MVAIEKPPLFDVNLQKIVFDQVYLNGLHVLKRMEIRNLSQSSILVTFRSSLGSQVAFQLSNENLIDYENIPWMNESTNSFFTSSSSLESGEDFKSSSSIVNQQGYQNCFNELFNYVNYVDHVKLQPGASKSIIIAYLPDVKKEQGLEEYNNFMELNGVLLFLAYKIDAYSQSIVRAESVTEMDNGMLFSVRDSYSSKFSEDVEMNSPSVLSTPDYQLSLKFRSRICKSVLWTDIDSGGIIFDDCVIGETYFRDFTIWNRSEIELYWMINTADLAEKKWLEFSDYDTGGPLDFSPIPAYSPKRIRITLKPKTPGDFTYDILIENENDGNNSIETRLHAFVRSARREEMLIINTGNLLDFSDCCTGIWKKKEIVLRNVSEGPLEVQFACDDPNVVFQLRTDEVNETRGKKAHRYHENAILTTFNSDTDLPETSSLNHLSARLTEFSLSHESLSSIESIGHHTETIETTSELEAQYERFLNGFDHNAATNEEVARIDEILMRPGRERYVEVCYKPPKDALTYDYRGGILTKRMFRITISYCHPRSKRAVEHYTVQCVARTCTSYIEVSPLTLNFGDTDVGTLKSLPVFVRNCSDLPARVEFSYVSKVLNSTRGEMIIPPRQTLESKIEIYPRKVNPDYKKQITVSNLLNHDNDCVIQVTSTNVDKRHITFHSLYYHILTSSSTNFLDFGAVVLNSPVIRSFTIENISKELVIDISTSMPNDIQIFVKNLTEQSDLTSQVIERRERLLESMDRRKSKRVPLEASPESSLANVFSNSGPTVGNSRSSESGTMSPEYMAQYLDLAAVGARQTPTRRNYGPLEHSRPPFFKERKRSKKLPDSSEPGLAREFSEFALDAVNLEDSLAVESIKTLDSLLAILEKENGEIPASFGKIASEERYVKRQQFLLRELQNYIKLQALVPASQITIPPNSSITIVLMLQALPENNPYIQSKPRKTDAKVFLKMIKFDTTLNQVQIDQLNPENEQFEVPVRELMIRCSLCRSNMELGQRNINFGTMEKGERRTKRIVIRNNSEASLMYNIKKSGSVASGDILLLGSKVGLIRGYGKREVEFIFEPSMPGQYMEKLDIENVQDPGNSQTVIVKANVRQPANFFVNTTMLDFGPCFIDQTSYNIQEIVISNPSQKHTRWFEVKVDPQELHFESFTAEVLFSVTDSEQTGAKQRKMLNKDIEEKIETLQQDLKIATTKGKKEKIEKIRAELDKLMNTGIRNLFSEADDDKQKATTRSKSTDHSIIVSIAPRCVESITIHFKPISNTRRLASPITKTSCKFKACVHEHKNTDIVKFVEVESTVFFDIEAYKQSLNDYRRISMITELPSSFSDPYITNVKSPESAELESSDMNVLNNLSAELSFIDLGRLEIDSPKECYFTLINSSDEEYRLLIDFETNELSYEGPPIVILARESKRIELMLYPKRKGLNFCICSLMNYGVKIVINFTYYGVLKDYLHFYKTLNERIYELDLGYCFFELVKTYAAIRPVIIKNICSDMIYVTAVSNLAQQCLIFTDHKLEITVVDMLLKPQQNMTIYIALQPSIARKSESQSSNETFATNSGARELIGGIKFIIQVKDKLQSGLKVASSPTGLVQVLTYTLKFKAIIGQSIFVTSTNVVDFGVTDKETVFKGGFWVTNVSYGMPLEIQLRSSSSKLVLDTAVGRIEPNDGQAESRIWIGFTLDCNSFGYFEESIECLNLNNSSNTLYVNVKAFVESRILDLDISVGRFPLTSLNWNRIYLSSYDLLPITVGNQIANQWIFDNQSISLKNTTQDVLILQLLSNIDILIHSREFEGEHPKFEIPKFHTVGALKVLPKEHVEFSVELEKQTKLEIPEKDKMDITTLKGSLILYEKQRGPLKLISIERDCCVSVGKVDQNVNLGRIGHFNEWAPIEFGFYIENTSMFPLFYDLILPECIMLISEVKDIPGKSSAYIQCSFITKVVSEKIGANSCQIVFKNKYNPHNDLNITVHYFMTGFELRFDNLQDGILCLPAMTHPQPANVSCDSTFTITNTSDEDVKFDIECNVADFSHLIAVEILSRFWTSTVGGSVLLSGKGSTEIKVRCICKETSKLLDTDPMSIALTQTDGAFLGHIFISSRYQENVKLVQKIPLKAIVSEGRTFSVSHGRLEFRSALNGTQQVQEVTIQNLSQKELHFKIAIQYPIELSALVGKLLKIYPLDNESGGVIAPGSSYELKVELKISEIDLSENIKVEIYDIHSVSKRAQTIEIHIIEDAIISDSEFLMCNSPVPQDERTADDDDTTELSSSFHGTFTNALSINLKGCKKINDVVNGLFYGLYELDLGQQDMSTVPWKRKLVLENPTTTRIGYRIKLISNSDQSWINCNRYDGVLETHKAAANNSALQWSHTVSLTCSLAIRGVFRVYILIENTENPTDLKIIRVQLEVVSKQGVSIPPTIKKLKDSNKVFEVYTHGLDINGIVMDRICFGTVYTARSIVIYNRDSVPLEFSLNTNLSAKESNEIVFSMSRTTARLFKTIKIDPDSSQKVYIRYWPGSSKQERNSVQNQDFEIYVNCRVVKDYQAIIPFKATCIEPQISVDHLDFKFVGSINGQNIEIHSENDTFTIFNNFEEDLEFEIATDVTFFGIDLMGHLIIPNDKSTLCKSSGPQILGPNQSIDLKLVPLMESLYNQLEYCKKEKYFVKHFVVYNKKRPFEKHIINVKFGFGYLDLFQMAYGSNSSFLSLESRIVRFLNTLSDSKEETSELYFTYVVILDQLVHYGTREEGAEYFLQLATLLFVYFKLMRRNLFAQSTDKLWIPLFISFMSYFPLGPVDTLKMLASTLDNTN